MTELLSQLKTEFSKYRMTFGSELELQNQIAEILTRAGIAHQREHVLSPEDRPDFLVQTIALEVKVGGSINSHLRQMQRYNRHATVAGTILICTKPFGQMMPETLAGKPIASINVGGNRL